MEPATKGDHRLGNIHTWFDIIFVALSAFLYSLYVPWSRSLPADIQIRRASARGESSTKKPSYLVRVFGTHDRPGVLTRPRDHVKINSGRHCMYGSRGKSL